MDGLSLTIGGTLGAAIVSAIVKIWTSRNGKVAVEPSPLDIHKVQDCVTIQECNRRMHEFDDRLTKVEARVAVGFDNILRKLDALDRKSEERAIAMNRRVDPIVEKCAAIQGQFELIKDKVFKR